MAHVDDYAPITEATRLALDTEVPAINLKVEVQAVSGDCARVRISDLQGELTPIFGFLKQDAQKWRLLSAGTDFEPAFYQEHQIPGTLRLS